MPVKQGKDGPRRSGQGVAAPALYKPIVKNFDPPRPPWMTGAGGSPSASVDTTWNQFSQQVMPDELSYTPGEEDSYTAEEDEGECGCSTAGDCRCPRGSFVMDEQILRSYIREVALHEFSAGDAAEQILHLGLDACGILFPGPGELCDVANVLLYARKGEWLNAAFSLISVIPEIGDLIGKGGKYTTWMVKTFPKGAEFTKKHAPKVMQAVKQLRTAIRAEKELIDTLLDKAEQDNRLAEYVPHIRDALDAFAKEREASWLEKEMDDFFEDVLGDLSLNLESAMIDEDEEEEEEDEIEEFSGVAALGGGPSLPLGMSTPSFGRKRKKKGREVRGFKPTHG